MEFWQNSAIVQEECMKTKRLLGTLVALASILAVLALVVSCGGDDPAPAPAKYAKKTSLDYVSVNAKTVIVAY